MRLCDKFMHMNQPSSHKIGYARVSTIGQNLDSQFDALRRAGCDKIFSDKVSGVSVSRPEWDKVIEYLRPGDVLVVTELSRMTRSLMHLLQLVQELEGRGVNIISLRENIDTSTATGRAFMHIIGAINQMERELKAERAAAGRAAAKARGKSGGRPRTDQVKLEQARVLYENTEQSAQAICDSLGIGRRTLFKYLAQSRQG